MSFSSVFSSVSNRNTVIRFRAHPRNPGWSHHKILNLILSVKMLFPYKVHSQVLGDIFFFGGCTIQTIILTVENQVTMWSELGVIWPSLPHPQNWKCAAVTSQVEMVHKRLGSTWAGGSLFQYLLLVHCVLYLSSYLQPHVDGVPYNHATWEEKTLGLTWYLVKATNAQSTH